MIDTPRKQNPTDYYQVALELIPEIIREERVVTDREIKVRLEPVFPWLAGYALKALVREGVVKQWGYKGRRPIKAWAPRRFFALAGTTYSEIVSLIKEKRDVTKAVNSQLTMRALAAYFAEDIFDEALENPPLEFEILDRNSYEFRGRRVRSRGRGPPPDLDFIVERDGVIYGIDIKNWIRYEKGTIDEVKKKVDAALQLGLVPFMIARYIDKSTLFTEIVQRGGLGYSYSELLFPITLSTLARRAEELLGYRVRCVRRLPLYMSEYILDLHDRRSAQYGLV